MSRVLLADFATVWNELFPAEQADRPAAELVERVRGDKARGADQGRGLRELGRGGAAAGLEESGMMPEVETKLEGTTLVVRIPMRFQRRGGRKRIVAPDGSAIVPTSKSQMDGALVKALARAWQWQRMLEGGEYGTLAELADAEQISRAYVCRVVRLTLLSPDIVERILDGRPTAGLAQLLKPFPVEWKRQRERLLGEMTLRALPAISCRPEQQEQFIWRCQGWLTLRRAG